MSRILHQEVTRKHPGQTTFKFLIQPSWELYSAWPASTSYQSHKRSNLPTTLLSTIWFKHKIVKCIYWYMWCSMVTCVLVNKNKMLKSMNVWMGLPCSCPTADPSRTGPDREGAGPNGGLQDQIECRRQMIERLAAQIGSRWHNRHPHPRPLTARHLCQPPGWDQPGRSLPSHPSPLLGQEQLVPGACTRSSSQEEGRWTTDRPTTGSYTSPAGVGGGGTQGSCQAWGVIIIYNKCQNLVLKVQRRSSNVIVMGERVKPQFCVVRTTSYSIAV